MGHSSSRAVSIEPTPQTVPSFCITAVTGSYCSMPSGLRGCTVTRTLSPCISNSLTRSTTRSTGIAFRSARSIAFREYIPRRGSRLCLKDTVQVSQDIETGVFVWTGHVCRVHNTANVPPTPLLLQKRSDVGNVVFPCDLYPCPSVLPRDMSHLKSKSDIRRKPHILPSVLEAQTHGVFIRETFDRLAHSRRIQRG